MLFHLMFQKEENWKKILRLETIKCVKVYNPAVNINDSIKTQIPPAALKKILRQ